MINSRNLSAKAEQAQSVQLTLRACSPRTRSRRQGSGDPGTAMSLAPLAYLLFQNVLVHDPADD